jgi:neurofibromin 1
VDPEKMVEGSDLDEMRWTLMAETQKILKSIINSIDKCPVQFRTLFAYVKECVEARYPGSVNVTIGGFYFLRFFCPAISSPEAYGILEEPPSASTRRLLILITKVLQSLSNDIEFGSKEPYMTKLNDFIHSNRAKLASFFEKLTKPGTKAPTPCVLPRNMKEVSLALLANFLKENIGKIDNPSMKAKLEPILG